MGRLACALSLMLLLAVPAIAQTVADQFLITPSVGIGPVTIGMMVTDAVAILGTPKDTRKQHYSDGDAISYSWFPYAESVDRGVILEPSVDPRGGGGLFALCTEDGTINVVATYYTPQYATANGLHTGLTEKEARAVMGEPAKVLKSKEWPHAPLLRPLVPHSRPAGPQRSGDCLPHQGFHAEVGERCPGQPREARRSKMRGRAVALDSDVTTYLMQANMLGSTLLPRTGKFLVAGSGR